jgi:hypothetical protein
MKHLTHAAASEVAQAKVGELSLEAGEQFELLRGRTVETERGWVFFYNTAEFVRTGNPLYALAGNGPIFVNMTGNVHVLPSFVPWQQALALLVE